MSSLEEIGEIIEDNLLFCEYSGMYYVVHKDDFVTVKDSEGKSWNVFRKGYAEKKEHSSFESFVTTTKSTILYEPGILVHKVKRPYGMRVLVKSKDGKPKLEELAYDRVFIENAGEEGVTVRFW